MRKITKRISSILFVCLCLSLLLISCNSPGNNIEGKWLYEGHHYQNEPFIPINKKDSMYMEFASYILVNKDSINLCRLVNNFVYEPAGYELKEDSIEIVYVLDMDKTVYKRKIVQRDDSLYFYSGDLDKKKQSV